VTQVEPAEQTSQAIPTRDDFSVLVIDAIVGVGFPTIAAGVMAERAGLATYSRNQGEPHWYWSRDKLKALPLPTLQELYLSLKEARDGS
jgi:hypothetical protein